LLLAAGCEDKGSYIPEPADLTPPGRITTLQAVASADSTVTLSWHAPGDDPRHGVASQYEIRYQRRDERSPWWECATPILEVASTAAYLGLVETVTISGLLPAERYYFAIKAADEVPNWSAMSNVAEVLVLPLNLSVSGKWVGLIYHYYPWLHGHVRIDLDLVHIAYRVTGTYEFAEHQGVLHSGMSRGGNVVLNVRFESHDEDHVFSGSLEGDRIEGIYWVQSISTGEIYGTLPWYVERVD
jgi:hypothetical protein